MAFQSPQRQTIRIQHIEAKCETLSTVWFNELDAVSTVAPIPAGFFHKLLLLDDTSAAEQFSAESFGDFLFH